MEHKFMIQNGNGQLPKLTTLFEALAQYYETSIQVETVTQVVTHSDAAANVISGILGAEAKSSLPVLVVEPVEVPPVAAVGEDNQPTNQPTNYCDCRESGRSPRADRGAGGRARWDLPGLRAALYPAAKGSDALHEAGMPERKNESLQQGVSGEGRWQ